MKTSLQDLEERLAWFHEEPIKGKTKWFLVTYFNVCMVLFCVSLGVIHLALVLLSPIILFFFRGTTIVSYLNKRFLKRKMIRYQEEFAFVKSALEEQQKEKEIVLPSTPNVATSKEA